MSGSREKDQRRRHRLARRGPTGRPRHHDDHPDDAPPMVAEIAEVLADGDPLGLLAQASGMLEMFRTGRHAEELRVSRSDFVASLIDVDLRETTALLTAWAALTDKDGERRLIESELRVRKHRLPAWLGLLSAVEVARVAVLRDVFGDVEQYLVELLWPTGEVLTMAAMLDANLGHALVDGLAFPVAIEVIEGVARQSDPEGDLRFEPADPAAARARTEQGIGHWEVIVPLIETESWPMARPLMVWALRHLPAGGPGRSHDQYDAARAAALAAEFASSSSARGLERNLAASIAEDFCWFAEFNCGDPLRWSPSKIDQLMSDWWARKIVAARDIQDAMPDVLDAFVRFCAAKTGLGRSHLRELRRVIEQLRPVYAEQLDAPRRDSATMLARLAAGLPVEDDEWPDVDVLALLADRVGGHDILDALDSEPLPDEEFCWDGVPDDVRGRVHAVLDVLDPHAEDLFGVEFRTASRRLLAQVASSDPEIFRRRGSEVTAACAVAFLVASENHLIGARGIYGKTLAERFGLKSMPTSRVETFKAAARAGGWTNVLGGVCHAGLLTSVGRQRLIERRDWWRAQAD